MRLLTITFADHAAMCAYTPLYLLIPTSNYVSDQIFGWLARLPIQTSQQSGREGDFDSFD